MTRFLTHPIWLGVLMGCGGGSAASSSSTPSTDPDPVNLATNAQVNEDPPIDLTDVHGPLGHLFQRAQAALDVIHNGAPKFVDHDRAIVFRSMRGDRPLLYVSRVAEPTAAPRLLVPSEERIPDFAVAPDGTSIVFMSDHGADEKFHLFRARIGEEGAVQLTAGDAIERDPPFFAVSRTDGTFAFSSRRDDRAETEIWLAPGLEPGAARVTYTHPSTGYLSALRPDGARGLFVEQHTLSNQVLFELDVASSEMRRVFPAEGEEAAIHAATYSHDGRHIYVSYDKDGVEASILVAMDGTGRETARFSFPAGATSTIDELSVSRTGQVAAHVLNGSRHELLLLDGRTLRSIAPISVPVGAGRLGGFSSDGRKLGVSWTTPVTPSDAFQISIPQRPRGSLELAPLLVRPTASPSGMRVEMVDIPRDGGSIPAFVLSPAGSSDGAAIVEFHGGPAASSSAGYSPFAAFFCSLGYRWVVPNIRGSTGYGRAYQRADDGRNRQVAIDDVATVGRWASGSAGAPVTIFGGSYGGYLVLMALTRQADIWASGIDLVGPSNWRSFFATTTGSIRQVLSEEFGSIETDGEFLDSISPLTQVDQIQDPLFVYQGANDPRVPTAESGQIVAALRARNVPVQYMIAENEGHSMDRNETRLEFLVRAAAFLGTVGPQTTLGNSTGE